MSDFLVGWIASIPQTVTPLLLASLGLILCERAGVLNLGAEGLMSVGAMTAAAAVLSGTGPWLALALGAGASVVLATLLGMAVVVFRSEQTLAGLATVALGLGFTGMVGTPYVQHSFAGFDPFGAWLGHGSGLRQILGALDAISAGAIALAVALYVWLTWTLPGLRLRAVGEDPGAADVAGVDVQGTQLLAVLASGALCGLGGAYLSVEVGHVWVQGMVGGRGWIAIALVIFARWHPLRALLGAAVFGAAEALTPRLQAVGADVPVYLMMMLPYGLTILILTITALRGERVLSEPESLSHIYVRQDKT